MNPFNDNLGTGAIPAPPSDEEVLVFPLSFAQQRLWVLDRLEPNSAFYNLPFARRISGGLNIEALERSLNEVIQRHEVLRTTFAMRDEEPVQVVTPNLYLHVPLTDLSGMSPEAAELEAHRLVNQEAQEPFDLARGPLLRVMLIRLDSRDHVLVFNMHHIVSDAWSVGLLMHELTTLYEAFTKGEPSPLPELPIQYPDFALWQREWLQGQVLDQQLAYWKSRLQGAPSLLDIPTDRPRPPVESFRGDSKPVRISSDLTERLKALGRQQHATLFMTLLTAFDILLSRYSGQDDIVVGTPIANRNRPEVENLIGFFANTLALRCDLSGNPTFIELLARSRETALGAYAHQDLPFERLVEELRPERSLSHNPLFQVIFALQNIPRSQQEMAGIKSQPFGAKVGTAKVDLALFITERPEGLMGALEYSTDIFDANTIGRWVNHFQHLLEAIVQNPGSRVSELPLLGEDERRQLLVEWNNTQAELPRQCVHQLFEAQAEHTPHRVAVKFEKQSLTYSELNGRANQLAHALGKMGVGPGKRVGVYIERSLEMMIALLGVQKAGAAYVPLDPDYPAERVRLTLDDAQVPVIITQKHLLGALPEHSAQVCCLDSDWTSIAAESSANPNSQVTPEDLMYVIFTSGSTGRPKGVQVPHRAVVNLLTSMQRELAVTQQDVLVALASFAFDMCIPELYLPLIAGGTSVIGAREHAADGQALASLLVEAGATIIHATPTTWNLLLAAGYAGTGCKRVVGAEPLPKELCTRLLEPEPSLYNFYGPTETTVWSTFHHFRSKDEPLTIGRPIANTQIYILDKYQAPVPIGVVGELYIGGDGVSCGYLNRPELNAEKFVPDPFTGKQDAKLYRTGDLARYLPDGRIEFLGRADNQVKIRGFRIELGEIESVLTQHPAVQQAIAIVREDVLGDKRLVAYLIPQKGITPDANDLRAFAKTKLPEYMIPSRFVSLEQFPLTPNGKVDRKALPAPDAARPEIEGVYIAPRTPVEEAVAGIWGEVLHIEQVGAYDEFFELGGHSLLATQVMSRIGRAFQVELPLRVIFETPTVAGLARQIEQARSAAEGLIAPPIVSVTRDRNLPLSFSQQRLWVLDKLQPGNPIYNMPQAIRLSGELDVDLLKRALQELVRRHEILRTTFPMAQDAPVQVVSPVAELDLPLVDLSNLPEGEREEEARRIANEEGRNPFNLKQGPVFRTTIVRLGCDEHVLLLNMHHIVSDRWSLGVLSRDLAAVYRAFSEGRQSPLPELPIQYADFAVWQREWLQGEVLERQLDYWKSQLAEAPPVLELPTDRPRPAIETFHGSTAVRLLPPELLRELKALSRREGVTLFMTLLAALDVLLWRYSGQDDILVGSPIANRNRTEVEDLIGFFVNTLVFRNDLSGNPSFRELLVRVREVALDAYAHQDIPFEKLVEALRLERSLSHNPLFQVMFALQNISSEKLRLSGLTLSGFPVGHGRSMFDFTVFMTESERGLLTHLEYNTDLFDAGTIEQLLDRFQSLLNAFVSNPDQRIAEVPLLSNNERVHLLEELNATRIDYPSDSCVHQLFEAQVERAPNAVAAAFGGRQLSYSELNCRANQLAHYLRQHGIGPDTLVGICLERSLDMVVAVLAVLKAGGAYVPIDPAYPKERIAFVLEDAKVAILLTQQSLLEGLPETGAKVVPLDTERLLISQCKADNPAPVTSGRNLAYVIFTSGSTGRPKGVQIEHRSVVNFLCSMRHQPGLDENDVLLAVTTLSFDIAGLELYLPLIAGAQVVLASHEEAQNGQALMAKIEEVGITIMQATPATWRLMLESGWQGDRRLKVLCGGEAFPRDLADQLLARCGQVWNMYGPTETTVWSTISRLKEGEVGPVSLGRPIANTQLFVLDVHRQPVPIGVAGELYIGGDGLARGYLNRPQLTNEKFVANPFSTDPNERLYRTGDLVRYRPDGTLIFLGRIDNQVKVRGFRIELGEIESVLSEHPAVQQSVVIAREDVVGGQQLVGYLVPNPDLAALQASHEELHAAHLEEWQMVWEGTYREALASGSADFNINGWNSSYTGLPIPQDEMREWVMGTVERIRGLRPRRVLEIGCGSGLLLFQLAPDCRHYYAVDFSENALQSIRNKMAMLDRSLPVTLAKATAHEVSEAHANSIDTVILNSVCQYFPSIDYLVKVLQGAIQLIEEDGFIFVGDVRNLALLPAFHTAVQLQQAPTTTDSEEILAHVRRRSAQEEELLVDPGFFTALQTHIPQISGVEILLKRGRYRNEMTQFRYDVILHVGKEKRSPAPCQWLDWEQQDLTVDGLRRSLKENRPDFLGIKGIPNARIWDAVSALNHLTSENAAETIGEIRASLDDRHKAAVDPEELWAVADELPYSVSVSWSGSGSEGYCTLALRRQGIPWSPVAVPGEHDPTTRAWSFYANNPIKGAAAQRLIPELREWLSDRLPNFMVPSALVALDTFPLTPNGKVDRRALPAPDVIRHAKTVPPRDDLERMLVDLWQKLLTVKPIGVTDNFFELGGHSLLAVRLMTEIQAATGKALPLATLFEGATIEYVAGKLRQEHTLSDQMVVEIQGSGSKPPFFGIVTPGMNALGYIALARNLGPEQPLYRIQGPGTRMRGRSYSKTDYENLAAEYIKAMKTIQPQGPYYLGGMCEGARIAFDMARLLEAQNEEVAFLGIFDTWVLENSQIRFLWKVDYYWSRFQWFRMLSLVRKLKYLAGWFQRRVKPESTSEAPTRGVPWPKAFWPGKDFVPEKFGGKITVFKNPKQPYFYVRDPLMGWGTRTAVGVELHEVKTKHGFFMREPYVRDLARKLSPCLHSSRTQVAEPKNRSRDAEATAADLVLSGERVSS